MECVLQGIIETQHVEALEILLRGLCGSQRENVKVHDICLRSAVGSELHLLCTLSQGDPVWTVRHVGSAIRGAGAEQQPAQVRSIIESSISSNGLRFFYALGYKIDYEMLRTGFSFRLRRVSPITITATSICRMPKLHAIDEAVPVTPGFWLVEVTSPASADNYSDVAAAISSFAEFLAPLMYLSKPGVNTSIVPTAATAAAALMSRGLNKTSA